MLNSYWYIQRVKKSITAFKIQIRHKWFNSFEMLWVNDTWQKHVTYLYKRFVYELFHWVTQRVNKVLIIIKMHIFPKSQSISCVIILHIKTVQLLINLQLQLLAYAKSAHLQSLWSKYSLSSWKIWQKLDLKNLSELLPLIKEFFHSEE